MTLRDEIERQADATEPVPVGNGPVPSTEPTGRTPILYRPFPVEALPPALTAIVSEATRAIGCDPAAVALPALSGLGVAIGNTRVLLAKPSWRVPPIVWSILAISSGNQKSPALDITADYFRERQAKLHADYRTRQAAENAKPKMGRLAVDPKVIWADDTTTEALAVAMETNPRGILLASDELGNWLGSMGLYKKNGAIADVSRYCQWYGNRGAMILRKDRERQTTFAKGVLGITGAMTLATLRLLADRSVRESGLFARMLPCCPPAFQRRWTDDAISPDTTRGLHDLLDRMFLLEGHMGGPLEVRLGVEARRRWQEFFNSHNEEAEALGDDDLRAAWSKLEELPCRLALILHESDGRGQEVSPDVMERAITLAEWFKHETRRVYAMLFGQANAPAAVPDASKLLEWMKGRHWATERDISRGLTAFKGPGGTEAARTLLKELIAGGRVAAEQHDAGKGGGRPTMKYRLVADQDQADPTVAEMPQIPATRATQPPASATQPPQTREKQGCVTVAAVAEPKTQLDAELIAELLALAEPEPQPRTLRDNPGVDAVGAVAEGGQWTPL